jgi:hypothetical protein
MIGRLASSGEHQTFSKRAGPRPNCTVYSVAMRCTAVCPGAHYCARIRLCFHAIEALASRPALAGGSRYRSRSNLAQSVTPWWPAMWVALVPLLVAVLDTDSLRETTKLAIVASFLGRVGALLPILQEPNLER